MKRLILLLCLFPGLLRAESYLSYVNPLQGTDSKQSISHGNTLPLVGTPWAMTDWAPETDDTIEGPWFFHYADPQVRGFRATHEPSPWMGDHCQFSIMPQTGSLVVGEAERASAYDVKKSTFKPDYLRIDLDRYHVTTELTASQRCGIFRFTFQDGGTGRLLFNASGGGEIRIEGRKVLGKCPFQTGTEPIYMSYFVAELDRDPTAHGVFSSAPMKDKKIDHGAYIEFSTEAGKPVVLRVGTSYLSFAQAERNLQQEAQGGFDGVRARTAATWEANLAKLEITGDAAQKETFYTCFYRAQKFPRRLYEFDGAGTAVHASPYDGKVHTGVLYADVGLWDTYRCLFPLYTILFPDELGEMISGFLNAYDEGKWFPQWPSPGFRDCMISTHGDAMVADAVVKGLDGFDATHAYEALRKNAFEVSPTLDRGRGGLADYLRLGYVPNATTRYAVSASLDNAYDDWCVAQVASFLGRKDDYKTLIARAENYKKLWDPSVGFMRARDAQGKWIAPFDQFAWGGPYVEGGPWQCTWAVQQDPEGLARLLGGRKQLGAKLDQMLAMPPIFHVGDYKKEIHEMTEMAVAKFGQYAHSNQPVHHVLYLFSAAGEPWKTEEWTRRVCAEMYNGGPDGFPGDEDNGEMATWYLMSSLGFYPLTPGQPSYVLTSPLFSHAVIHLPDGKTFTIDAPGNGPATPYVERRFLNDQPAEQTFISHAAIMAGGTLRVETGDKPNIREVPEADLPYALTWELEGKR